MDFNTHSELGLRSRIHILWTFSRRKYTIQRCIIHLLCTAWLQSERAAQGAQAHAYMHVHLSSHPLLLHTYYNPSSTSGVWTSLSCLALSSSWKQNGNDHLEGNKHFRQKKNQTTQRSTLSSCNPFMVFPIHLMLVRPGEGFLHTVLPMLCGPDLHFSAIFYNARAARKVRQVFQYVPAGTQ